MDRKTKTDLSPYIVNVQGKDFITFPGLLAEAHAQGLTSINTQLINEDLTNPVMKATVQLGDKTFSGYGDANANNVAKKVAGALIRMAETRAVARALRFACNIDMTALEEIDAEENVISKQSAPSKLQVPVKKFAAASVKTEETTEEVEVKEEAPARKVTFSKRPKAEPSFP